MGVLDDAIREHLELKRLHGADPGEVAHLERHALGATDEELDDGAELADPEFDDGDEFDAGHALDAGETAADALARTQREAPCGRASSDASGGEIDLASANAAASGPYEPPGTGRETVEIDMRTVIGDGLAEGNGDASHRAPLSERRWRLDRPRRSAGRFPSSWR